MASYQTKLKIGRKLEGVDTDVASDNQISLLLRYDEETGDEDHVSVSIESDAMTVDDVFALLEFLDERGILTTTECKTWLHQSKASREEHGSTTEWAGEDLERKVSMAKKGLRTRSGGSGGGERARKQALVKVNELERELGELKATLRGGEDDDADEADTDPTTDSASSTGSDPSGGSSDESEGPTPPNAL